VVLWVYQGLVVYQLLAVEAASLVFRHILVYLVHQVLVGYQALVVVAGFQGRLVHLGILVLVVHLGIQEFLDLAVLAVEVALLGLILRALQVPLARKDRLARLARKALLALKAQARDLKELPVPKVVRDLPVHHLRARPGPKAHQAQTALPVLLEILVQVDLLALKELPAPKAVRVLEALQVVVLLVLPVVPVLKDLEVLKVVVLLVLRGLPVVAALKGQKE